MSIQVVWDDPTCRTLTIQAIKHDWSADDMKRAVLQAWELIQSVEHRVGVILDVRAGNRLPPNTMALSRWTIYNRPRNLGDVIVLGGTPEMREINAAVQRTYKKFLNLNYQVFFVDTFEEAQSIADHLARQ